MGGLAAWVLMLAATTPGELPMPAQVFDPERSEAWFRVSVRFPMRVDGHFPQIHGALHPAGEGRWRVLAELDAPAVRFRGPEWLGEMTRSSDFLDVGRYPRIVFESRPFPVARLRRGGALPGWLTLRGQRREVEFSLDEASCARPGYDCPVRVTGVIQRSDFGMTSHRFTVRNPVRFDLQIQLEPEP